MKVEIIDTGIGIQNERKLHILQFISGNANSYDSGIGLYASKLILGYIGSDKIYLQSTINYGTEFSFIVDIKSNQSIRKCTNDFILEDNYNLIQIDEENYDILIVDDIELNRKILISTLKDLRPNCLEAENGQKAVEIVKKMNDQNKHIKVIIMDISMPIMDGWEASKAIKDMEKNKIITKSPKIIAYTTYSSNDDINLCYQAGMTYCLNKPSTPSTILKVVNYYLSQY